MAVANNMIRLLGRYSEGLRLTAEHGPHSGVVREYVYRNRPHGNGTLGWWIDKTFLQLGTWDALRQRAQATKRLLVELLTQRRLLGWPTMILDVASGTAPYLRELVREHGREDLRVVCHDRDPRQVTHGRKLVASEGLSRFDFAVGDATDHASYLTSRDPDLILAIDLFPWFQEDQAVRTTLRLAFEHLTVQGCLVCSTLTRRRSGPWDADAFGCPPAIRSADTVADWMREAGFAEVQARPIYTDGCALLGWKPGK
jgi:SAM-dependent methyltransferase